MTAVAVDPGPVTGLALVTVTGEPGGLPALFEDPEAPHQIVLQFTGHRISLSCTCLGVPRRRSLIDTRDVLPAVIALAVWRAWHRRRGIEVGP